MNWSSSPLDHYWGPDQLHLRQSHPHPPSSFLILPQTITVLAPRCSGPSPCSSHLHQGSVLQCPTPQDIRHTRGSASTHPHVMKRLVVQVDEAVLSKTHL